MYAPSRLGQSCRVLQSGDNHAIMLGRRDGDMREQEVWFIGGPEDVCRWVSYPLRDRIYMPFIVDGQRWDLEFYKVAFERVGLDVYRKVGH